MAGLNQLVDKIRTAYPGAYDDMDDATLTKRVLNKYPQYSDLAAPSPASSVAKPAPMETSALGHLASQPVPRANVANTQEGMPGFEGSYASGDEGKAAAMTTAGVGAGLPILGAKAMPVIGGIAAKHPLLTSMVLSEAISQARHVPYVGRFVPPYSELLPFLMSEGKGAKPVPPEAAPAAELPVIGKPQALAQTPRSIETVPHSTWPPAAPRYNPESQVELPKSKPFRDVQEDSMIQDAMRQDLSAHQQSASMTAAKEFAAGNSMSTPKSTLIERARDQMNPWSNQPKAPEAPAPPVAPSKPVAPLPPTEALVSKPKAVTGEVLPPDQGYTRNGSTFYRNGKMLETGEDIADALKYFEDVGDTGVQQRDFFKHKPAPAPPSEDLTGILRQSVEQARKKKAISGSK